jgi:hypothetical protein
MSIGARDYLDVRNRASAETAKAAETRSDAGAAYRQARAHVLEASASGLVRLRVI